MSLELAMYRALKSIDVPEEKIEAVIKALNAAMEARAAAMRVPTPPATPHSYLPLPREPVANMKMTSTTEFSPFKDAADRFVLDFTINFGLMLVATVSVMLAVVVIAS